MERRFFMMIMIFVDNKVFIIKIIKNLRSIPGLSEDHVKNGFQNNSIITFPLFLLNL